MKNVLKKLRIITVITVFAALLALCAYADGEVAFPARMNADGSESFTLENYCDINEFRDYLLAEFTALNETIDVTSYDLPPEMIGTVVDFIVRDIPEAFHVSGFGWYGTDSQIWNVCVQYDGYTAESYAAALDACKAEADGILNGIKDNDSLTDVQKALLIHDRLCLGCEYDYQFNDISYTMYGALVNGSAVCDGYTKAYSYLLRQVGIESRACVSFDINHAWNLIKIDGKYYHVDVTWDDLAWTSGSRGVEGGVRHYNFLRSNAGIIETGHINETTMQTDYYAPALDTEYDEYFWQDSNSAFLLIGNKIYYMDTAEGVIKTYDGDEVCAADDKWYSAPNRVWQGNFTRIATDGRNIIFSLSETVRSYDTRTGQLADLYAPELEDYDRIYGLSCKNGYIYIDINNAPSVQTSRLYQIVVKHEPPEEETYTVRFTDYDGSVISEAEYHYGDAVVIPDGPVRNADNTYTYTFAGWDGDVAEVTGDAVYTAVYTAEYIDYTVVFKNHNGSVLTTDTYHYGDTVTAPEVIRLSDLDYYYVFTGWSPEVTTVSGDAEYTACFEAKEHEWDAPVYVWSEDHLSCTASKTSKNDDTIKYEETVDASCTTVPAGCETDGSYTCKAEFSDPVFTAQTYEEILLKTGHNMEFTGFSWTVSEGERGAAACYECSFCKTVTTVKAAITAELDASSCEEAGAIVYTAVIIAEDSPDGKEHTDTATEPVEGLEHIFVFDGFSWDEDEDGQFADGIFTCERCGAEKQIAALMTEAETEPTCTDDGQTVYTAVIYGDTSPDGQDHRDEITVKGTPAKGHVIIAPLWIWSEDLSSADAVFACAVCDFSHTECADVTVTVENGVILRTASVIYDGAEYKTEAEPEYIDYTVTFYDWDGAVISENTYHYGDQIAAPDDPQRAEDDEYTYAFTGWDKQISPVYGDAEYTAVYEATEKQHDDPFIPGDVNGDGQVNNKDIVAMFRYVSGAGGSVNAAALDPNGDGQVNNKDIVALFRYVSGGDISLSDIPYIPAGSQSLHKIYAAKAA